MRQHAGTAGHTCGHVQRVDEGTGHYAVAVGQMDEGSGMMSESSFIHSYVYIEKGGQRQRLQSYPVLLARVHRQKYNYLTENSSSLS